MLLNSINQTIEIKNENKLFTSHQYNYAYNFKFINKKTVGLYGGFLLIYPKNYGLSLLSLLSLLLESLSILNG